MLDYDPITQDAIHPNYDNSKSISQNIAELSKYKIGKVENIVPSIGGYLCDVKITDERAAEFVEMLGDKTTIPVSPQILLTDSKSEFTHLAVVWNNNTAPKVITVS